MRVLLMNDYPAGGGAEIAVLKTKKLLEKNGHHVRVFCGGRGVGSLISRWFSLKYYYRAKRAIADFEPDVVHVHNFSRSISPSPMAAAKRAGVPVLLTVHDFHLYCPKTWGIFSDGTPCRKGYNRFCPFYRCMAAREGYRHVPYHILKWMKCGLHRRLVKLYADYYTCVSKKCTKLLERTLSISKDKISYLPYFTEGSDEGGQVEMDAKLFLFVGRLSKEKGADVAIKAIAHLVNEGLGDIKLRIIGDGPELGRLSELAHELGVGENVEFLGHVENQNLSKHYREACAVLIPSLWLENGPIVALEAMNSKRPIIGSRLGGVPEMVKGGETGYLFEAGNHLALARCVKELYGDKKRALKLGGAGFNLLQKRFSQEEHYKKLMRIYNKVIDEHGKT